MIPAPFEYRSPLTLGEALKLVAEYGDEAKVLAGGHSLIPAMKLRLARPKVVIDIGRVRELSYIRPHNGGLAIGALTTYSEIESSGLVRERCPLLSLTAPQIGDLQVRNKGTIGGSLAHADPAADWPAAMLALDAELDIVNGQGSRTVAAADFFVDMFQTLIGPRDLLCEIRVRGTGGSVAYVKTPQKASGFAVAGVAVVVDPAGTRIGITGVAPKPYRATRSEEALRGQKLTSDTIAAAASHAAEGVSPLGDIHASAEYRAHLARVNTARALRLARDRA